MRFKYRYLNNMLITHVILFSFLFLDERTVTYSFFRHGMDRVMFFLTWRVNLVDGIDTLFYCEVCLTSYNYLLYVRRHVVDNLKCHPIDWCGWKRYWTYEMAEVNICSSSHHHKRSSDFLTSSIPTGWFSYINICRFQLILVM